eukprot:Gb_37687 [translate_table: standard]
MGVSMFFATRLYWEDDNLVIGPRTGSIEGVHARVTMPSLGSNQGLDRMRTKAMGSQGHKRFGWKPPHEDIEDIDQLCYESYKSKDEEFKRQWFFERLDEDYFCTLKSLKQEGFVKEYSKGFLKASLLLRNLGFPRQIAMLVDGLKEDIKGDLRVLKPKNLELAIRMPPHMNKSMGKPGAVVVTTRTTSVDDKVKLSTNELVSKVYVLDENEGVEEANEDDQGGCKVNIDYVLRAL